MHLRHGVVYTQRVGEILKNADHVFPEQSLIITNWLIMMAKVFPHRSKEKETLANTLQTKQAVVTSVSGGEGVFDSMILTC